jgi:hypothetical protein
MNKEERKEYMRKWQQKNKDKLKINNQKYYRKPEIKQHKNQQSKEYKDKNKDKIKEGNRIYRETHKDKQKEWKENNKGKINSYTAKRRVRLISSFLSCANTNKITKIYEQARKLTKETGIKHEVDHIIPLQGKNVCGFHVEWNLQVITKEENQHKKNK